MVGAAPGAWCWHRQVAPGTKFGPRSHHEHPVFSVVIHIPQGPGPTSLATQISGQAAEWGGEPGGAQGAGPLSPLEPWTSLLTAWDACSGDLVPASCSMSQQRTELLLRMIYEFLSGENGSCTLPDIEPGPGGAGMSNALSRGKGLSAEQGMI